MQDHTTQDRTSAALARFLIGAEGGEEGAAPDLSRAAGLARRYPAARGGEFCSHAGLQQRPWLTRLRRALREGLFVLHYQPIVCLRSGRISHHEALLRLADEPDGELVAPGRFLPAAERHGLVREIDSLVLREAIALMGGLADRDTPVAVNLSALSVTSPGTLSYLAAQLGAHGVEPGRLILEVTETAAISDMARANAFCAGARQLGCAVALDDFGSGFGSFSYLKRLPFDFLKIDGDFVRCLPRSRSDQLVVQALVSVAKGLGRRTIAEYVEGQETIELLRAYGVDCAQGFAIGRPVAPVQAFALAA
jgi:EAL domain-containing protein (putative c-di-GMP-specific phosphodiesterase class I)